MTIRAEKTGWRDEAVCGLGVYPEELWFSRQTAGKKLAKAICLACPVIDECTAYAVVSPTGHGIVAGMSPSQVTRLKKELRHAA